MVSICEIRFDQDAKKDKKVLNWSMCGLLYEIRGFVVVVRWGCYLIVRVGAGVFSLEA